MHINIWGAVCSKFFNKSQDSKNARDPNNPVYTNICARPKWGDKWGTK